MPPKKRQCCISAEVAINNIMNFIENEEDVSDVDSDDELGDLSELCGNQDDVEEEKEVEPEDAPEEDDIVTDTRADRLRKRQLTRNRNVCSIDTAIDIANYDSFPIPEIPHSIEGVVKVDRNANNDIHYLFSNQPRTNNVGRINRANVITGPQGVQPKARQTDTNEDAFHLFITPDMINNIVMYSNMKIRKTLEKLPDNYNANDNGYGFMRLINSFEMNAFIGLFLYRGLYKLNTIDTNKLFSNTYGPPLFSATMSRNRFNFILSHLSFDDENTRHDRWKLDRFAAIREFFEMFNNECMTTLVPGDYLSLDETLYAMRTQVSFKQYKPNKPAKYDLLFKSINAARYPFTFIAAAYSGKPIEEGGDFYVPGTENIVHSLISRLDSQVSLAGRNISFDRLYTSFSLLLWLYNEKYITSIGTLQINRKGIPPVVKDMANREPLSTKIYWQENGPLSLSSYVVKTSQGKKNVLLLSTVEPILVVTSDDNKVKPALYKLYDFTKGGTDIIDQRMGFLTCKVKSRRWTLTAFTYILDMARVNSSTIKSFNEGSDPLKQDSFKYTYELVMQLVKPFIQQRNTSKLPWIVKNKIELVLGRPEPIAQNEAEQLGPATHDKRGRCHVCVKGCAGQGYGEARNHVTSMKNLCQLCGKYSCKTHTIQKCVSCSNK